MQTEGDILRLEIKKSGLRQEDFASQMGFSRNYLLRLMERAVLPEEIKLKASKILKIKPSILYSVQMQTEHPNIVQEGTPVYELSATVV